MQETGFSAGPNSLANGVADFVGANNSYYEKEFERIQSATKFPWSWNTMAAVAGPFWGATRGLWGFFWTFLVLEILALVQIGKGLWGELGADKLARAEKLTSKYNEFYAQAEIAKAAGESTDSLITRADNLKKVTERLMEEAAAASSGALTFLVVGLLMFAGLRLFQGYYANMRYEKQYLTWRAEPGTTPSGLQLGLDRFQHHSMAGYCASHPLQIYGGQSSGSPGAIRRGFSG